MAKIDLNEFIEVEDTELASGMAIDTSKLEEERADEDDQFNVDSPVNKVNTETKQEDLITVSDKELNSTENVDDSKTSTKEDDGNDDINKFHAFSMLLKEKGMFPNIGEDNFKDINNVEGIIDLLNKQLGEVNKTWQGNYTQHLVQNLLRDGIIKESQLTSQITQRPSKEDISSNEQIAKNTIQDFYRSKDIPETQITAILDSVVDVEEEALKLLPLLKESDVRKEKALAERIKTQEEEQLNQQTSFNDQLSKSVYEYKEFIPGRVLSDEDKQNVATSIPSVLSKINSNLLKYAPILAFLDKYDFLEGDMSKLLNEANTKGVSAFEKALESKQRGSSSNTTSFSSNKNAKEYSSPQIYK